MKREIRLLIIYTCGWIASLSVVIFFFTLWLFSYNNIEDPLKEAWTTTFTALSAFTTFGAAIIAANLFNDWRDQHNKQVDSDFIMKLYDCLFEMRQYSTVSVGFMRDYLNKNNKHNYSEDLKNHNNILCHLIDFSALKLSDVAYVITKDDYTNRFSPQIFTITSDLHDLNDLYRLFLDSDNPDAVEPTYKELNNLDEIDTKLSETLESLNKKYRSFLVELKSYYKAI